VFVPITRFQAWTERSLWGACSSSGRVSALKNLNLLTSLTPWPIMTISGRSGRVTSSRTRIPCQVV